MNVHIEPKLEAFNRSTVPGFMGYYVWNAAAHNDLLGIVTRVSEESDWRCSGSFTTYRCLTNAVEALVCSTKRARLQALAHERLRQEMSGLTDSWREE